MLGAGKELDAGMKGNIFDDGTESGILTLVNSLY